MKYSSLILNCLTAVILSACSLQSQKQDIIESRVEELLDQMTLQEKIGQMNQLTSTGNVDEMVTMAKDGKIGSFLNITDAKVVDRIQKAAVEESRLGIPVLMARDVIHGYKTIFPIPLGQAATFNPHWWKKERALPPLKPHPTESGGRLLHD